MARDAEKHRETRRRYRERNLERERERERQRFRKPGAIERHRRQRDPAKEKARATLRNAVAAGKVSKPSVCDHCGQPGKISGHHHDYEKPLDVEWVCSVCHGLEHRKPALTTPPTRSAE